ncbi:MAG: HAMP domain-containing methyl-accepting chemotaxis protein [Alphaproteobacteria bacterium]|nr:HAMP domain-containing methyl-accepting chemotaxis protein [Alphaproteobacteria bacterium]
MKLPLVLYNHLSLRTKLLFTFTSLLVPLVLMCLFYFFQIKHKIDFIEQEQRGISYIRTMNIYVTNRREENLTRLRNQNREIHEIWPAVPLLSPHFEKLDSLEFYAEVVDQISQVNRASEIFLDPEAETYYGALFIGQIAPNIISTLNLFNENTISTLSKEISRLNINNRLVNIKVGVRQALSDLSQLKTGEVQTPLLRTIELRLNEFESEVAQAALEIVNSTNSISPQYAEHILRKLAETSLAYTDFLTEKLQARNRAAYVNLINSGVIVFIGLGFCVILIVLIYQTVGKPLDRVTRVVEGLANQNLEQKLIYTDRRDEVGRLTRSVDRLITALRERLSLIDSQREQDQTLAKRAVMLGELNTRFRHQTTTTIGIFSGAAEELSATAREMNTIANAARERTVQVSTATKVISGNIENVAAASQALVAALSTISGRITSSQQTTKAAVVEANESIFHITELSEAAQKIGAIVGLINSIASQTNLLALNATIEAARAGEAGRGFAVVANEVKSLAAQTARATEEISSQIEAMQIATETAVTTIQRIAGTIQRIDTMAEEIQESLAQERTATQEISRSVSEAVKVTSVVADSIESVSTVVNQTTAASLQVLSASTEMSEQAQSLHGKIRDYLDLAERA